ncbi:MAG: hypothetical protein WA584_20980 [Pyrinomonadaceae bacterium]
MNIKNLRKNYDQLSKRERFILYDAAENRDDKSEMDAIMVATPNEDWIKPDFALQAEQILKMRLVMLIQQLKHCREAMFWFALSIEDERTNGHKKRDEFFYESARLSAYFYQVNVATLTAIQKEIGLDVEAWETQRNKLFDFDFAAEMTEQEMEHLAFSKEEAEAFINKIGNERGIKNIVLGFTVEKELSGLRELLKTQGFDEFFKN